ncbi:AarF/ABC1/UbiB kinase family protein [Oceanicaulis alexandrii]|uniref:ABC1 kinase family protein n=1 Tax=Oceanicaulis alexandrii TaxID=153233 RepID=UPI0035D0096A
MTDKADDRGSAVPKGRLSRLGRFGRLAAGTAGEALGNTVQALARGETLDASRLILTPSNAKRMADELAHLRGAAMKMGQMLSMDSGDLLPPELSDVLARLRESARPMPPHQLKRVLTQNLGPNWLSRFERFEPRPMAAASIGQVHRAKTKDGRDLAIKVQYPGVRDSIDSDVDNLASLIALSGLAPKGLDLKPILQEVKRQLKDEADYAREGEKMALFRDWLAGSDSFATPELAADLTTANVLAMSYLPGDPIETLTDALPSERNRVMAELANLTLREVFEFGAIQSDPNFANYRYQPDTGRVGLLDFGAVQEIPDTIQSAGQRLLHAGLSDDAAGREQALTELGYLSDDTPPDQRALVLELTDLALSPLFSAEPYDFDASALVEPLREGGFRLRAMGYARTPEPMAVFIQRKVAGLYLLGAKLDARLDIRALMERHI